MANPEMMQDMMKKNLGGLVPQVLTACWPLQLATTPCTAAAAAVLSGIVAAGVQL